MAKAMKKKRATISAAGRRRISLAQKKRWRRAKAGNSKLGPRRKTAKRGRPRKSANAFLNMTVVDLVATKKQLDEAWKICRKLLKK